MIFTPAFILAAFTLIPISPILGSPALVSRLDNGMDVVLVENHSVAMIAANVIIRVGSRDEDWETWGAAHFLEHMLFNGTADRTQEEIYDTFDRIGAYHNAHTASHFTDFMLLTSRENFTAGFEILADMLFNSTLPPHKFEKERGIVSEEIARTAVHGFDADRALMESLFGSSPLSRPVLGTAESITRLDREKVIDFYDRHYIPNNMMLFATGDFAADTLLEWFQSRLSKFPPREMSRRRIIDAPHFAGFTDHGVAVREAPVKKRELKIAYAAPMPGSADFMPFMMAGFALERWLDTGLPVGASGGYDILLDPDLAVFKLSITVSDEKLTATSLLESVEAKFAELAAKPPSPAELEKFARKFNANQVFNSEKLHYYGIMNAGYWGVVSWDEFDSWGERLRNVQPAEVAAVVKRYLAGADRLAIVFEPVSTVGSDSVRAPIMSDRRQPHAGPVIIARSDPSARVFALHVLVKDRWRWDRIYGAGSVDVLHRTLMEWSPKRGVTLADRLDEISAALKCVDENYIPYDDYYTVPDFSFIRLEMLPDRWLEGVKLTADLMSEASISEKAFANAREQTSAAATNHLRSPVNAGRARLREQLYKGSALAAPVYGDVSGVTASGISDLKSQYFSGGNLIISAVGPVGAGEVTAAVEAAFAALPPYTAAVSSEDTVNLTAPGTTFRDTLALGSLQGAVVMGRRLNDVEAEDRAALVIANAWFNDRMGNVLRERRGLAYSLGSSIQLLNERDALWGNWEISIATRPYNLSEAETGVTELLGELADHTFTAGETVKLANAVIGRLLMRDMARIGEAYSMGTGEFYWNDPDYRTHLIDEISKLGAAEVENAAKKYMTASGFSVVIVQ